MKKKRCAADGVRTYEGFGEGGDIRKCYKFSTKPSICWRNLKLVAQNLGMSHPIGGYYILLMFGKAVARIFHRGMI